MECFDRTQQRRTTKQGVYPEVPDLLHELADTFQLAIASHSPDASAGKGVLRAFGLLHLFPESSIHVFPFKSKAEHIERCVILKTPTLKYPTTTMIDLFLRHRLRRQTRVPFKSMLFFDDKVSCCKQARSLGVVSYQVKNGVCFKSICNGLNEFVDSNKSSSFMMKYFKADGGH
jgi:hypothetical protein